MNLYRVWEIGRRFTFAEGRRAAFLLDKTPTDITEADAIRAFMPYNAPGEWTINLSRIDPVLSLMLAALQTRVLLLVFTVLLSLNRSA